MFGGIIGGMHYKMQVIITLFQILTIIVSCRVGHHFLIKSMTYKMSV